MSFDVVLFGVCVGEMVFLFFVLKVQTSMFQTSFSFWLSLSFIGAKTTISLLSKSFLFLIHLFFFYLFVFFFIYFFLLFFFLIFFN